MGKTVPETAAQMGTAPGAAVLDAPGSHRSAVGSVLRSREFAILAFLTVVLLSAIRRCW